MDFSYDNILNNMKKIIFEYLWLDSSQNLCSKIKVIYGKVDKIPIWNYDGTSTGQIIEESGLNSEAKLVPVNYIIHPFLEGAYLVLCETFTQSDNYPLIGNTRTKARENFEKYKNKKITFGLEQEFFLISKSNMNDDKIYNHKIYKKKINRDKIDNSNYYTISDNYKTSHYCKSNNIIEIKLMRELLNIAIKCGLQISGINKEVAESQWEYQIGPVEGIEAADQMIFMKYILNELCLKYSFTPLFENKPFTGENGSGCHINISFDTSMKENGLENIKLFIENMEKDHNNFINHYSGNKNKERLTGKNETASFENFTYGIGTRHTSVRIPFETYENKKGYFEDRRPGANINYYSTLNRYLNYF